jgi:hypothetical protein
LLAKWLQLRRKLLELHRDEMIVDRVKALEPKGGELIEHSTLCRNGVRQDHVEGG